MEFGENSRRLPQHPRLLEAFVEYDDSPLAMGDDALAAPFSERADEALLLHEFSALLERADPRFLDAIAGNMEEKPTVPLRGLPCGLSVWVSDALDEADSPQGPVEVSWLLWKELRHILQIREFDREDLDLGVQLLLHAMEFFAEHLGADRVRFVYRVSRNRE